MQSAVAAIEALLILFLMGAFGWTLRSRRLVAIPLMVWLFGLLFGT